MRVDEADLEESVLGSQVRYLETAYLACSEVVTSLQGKLVTSLESRVSSRTRLPGPAVPPERFAFDGLWSVARAGGAGGH